MADIGVRLTGDNTQFRSMLSQSVEQGAKFAGDIGTKVGGKLFELRDVSTAIATALGLNLQNIAENVARVFSGLTKEEEKAFQKLEQVSDQLTEQIAANMKAMLTDEQRYQQLLQNREKLELNLSVMQGKSGQDSLRITAARLAIERQSVEIRELEQKFSEAAAKRQEATFKKEDEALKKRRDANEQNMQADLSTLSTAEKVAKLKQSIADLEALIGTRTLSRAESEHFSNQLAERRRDLVKEEATLADQAAKAAEDAARKKADAAEKEAERQKELGALLVKGAASLNAEEKLRLELLTGQTTQKKIDIEISQLNAKALNGQLLPAERERLAVLTGQSAQLEKQVEDTHEIEKTVKNISSITRVGTSYEGQSSSSLEGVRANLRKQADAMRNDTSFASTFSPNGRNPMLAEIEGQLAIVERELASRRTVGDFANRFGEDAARFRFGDTLTDRALRDLQDSSTRTTTAIETIADGLKRAGFIPR